ncbi:MAG: GGDEF domain-containing protein [Solirubrobacteraceae bacterium]|nr:GGDEF domain-containing protein [Solirubrobacteraceae bacterium]
MTPTGAGADLAEVAPAIAQASGKARRDIAVVPLLVIAGGAAALLVSEVLRPRVTGGMGSAAHVTIGLSVAALVLCGAWFPARRLLRRASSPTLLWAYTGASATLLIGLAIIAAFDQGLATVAIGAAALIAPSAGLALPARWSRLTIAGIVLALVAVQTVQPEASALEAATMVGLVIAGWVVGLILRRGHRGASRDALLLSRGDQATGVLNRRGFIENVAHDLDHAAADGQPLLLVAIGLRDGLGAALEPRALQDASATSTEDPLAEVARRLGRELPAGASMGRLGAAKLGVVIPGGRSIDADWFASTARAALDGHAAIFLGAASSPDGSAPLAELFDVAEACLLEARRRSPQGVQLSEVVDRACTSDAPARRPRVRRPPVTYARLQAAGGPPTSVEPWGIDGQWMLAGLSTVALAGLLFVVGSRLEGAEGLAATVVAYGGLPWVAAAMTVGFAYRRHPRSAGRPPLLPVLLGSALVVGGISVAALSTGSGALSPILAGLYLKAFFDASTFERNLARGLGLFAVVAWLLVLALGPDSAWWAAPFQAAMLLGAFALGTLGHNAYNAATSGRLDLARTDPFTGLLDRGRFYEEGEVLLALGDPAGRATFGVILVDVEPLAPRGIRAAPVEGPRRTAAGVVAQHLRDASAVARFGSGDFRAIVRVESRSELEAVVRQLRSEVSAASSLCRVGGALYGPDGVTLDALLAMASHRAMQDEELAAAA